MSDDKPIDDVTSDMNVYIQIHAHIKHIHVSQHTKVVYVVMNLRTP